MLALSLGAACPTTAEARSHSLGEVLATARKDALVQARQGGDEFKYSSYGGVPYLRDLEFKVRNEGFSFPRQRYTLEVRPRGFGENRAARLYTSAQLKHSAQRDKVLLNQALFERYLLVVDLLMRQATDRLYQEMITVTEDRIKVLDKRRFAEDFDLNKLVDAEADLTKLKTLSLDARKEMEVIEQRIAADLAPEPYAGLDTVGMISIDAIIAETEKSTYVLDTNHVYLQYLDQGLGLAEKRFRLEQAESRQWLNSISFSYDVGERLDEIDRRDEGKDYDLARAYIIEASFKIPGLTSNSVDLNRRKEDFLSEKEDVEEKRRELRQTMEKDIRDIHSLVGQYRYLMARENEVDAQASLKKYLQMTGVDPLILLSIKAGSLKNRLKIEEVKFGILLNYIKVMDATGRLSREPLRNFLSAKDEVLAP